MKKLFLALSIGLFTAGVTSLVALNANIGWGSAAAAGGGLFQGADGNSADSITIGYFIGDSASADLTGWNVLGGPDTSFNTTAGFNLGDAVTNVDVTAANGLDAWILIIDGSLSALVRANDWADISGVAAPGTPQTLSYTFDAADTSAGTSFLAATGTNLTITDNGGQGGASGLGFQLTAVPEPSAFALLAGCFGLGWVMLRRRAS